MKHVIPGQLRLPEFGLVTHWLVTEKIDGTNLRVRYEPWLGDYPGGEAKVSFSGRTDNASLHPKLTERLEEIFTRRALEEAFPGLTEPVWLYGEGYGPKVQSGGWYTGGKDSKHGFRLFDVLVGRWWLNWENVENVAEKLGIETVPVLSERASLEHALSMVKLESATAAQDGGDDGRQHEGIVCRTNPLLFTRSGERLMWKLKVRDLPFKQEE